MEPQLFGAQDDAPTNWATQLGLVVENGLKNVEIYIENKNHSWEWLQILKNYEHYHIIYIKN